MEDIVIVESSDYAQVVFDEVAECYLENNDLECKFTLNELLKPDRNDFVGVYKVGFTGVNSSYTTQPINVEEIVDNKGKIVFSSDKLPKDDGEFYQLVYVSQGKHIRGASLPFEFKRHHVNDYVQVDDQEAIIIKTKESEINDTLTEMKSKLNLLTHSNENYERLIKENEELIKLLKDEINMGKLRYTNVSKDNEQLLEQLNFKSENYKLIQETMISLADENKNIRNKYENLLNENRNMGELLQKRINQVELLRTELDSFKQAKNEIEMILNLKEQELSDLRKDREEYIRLSHELKQLNVDGKISKLECQISERIVELDKIKQDLRKNEQLVGEQQNTIQAILAERDSLNAIIQKLQKEKADLEQSHDSLSQELLMKTDKLNSVEECKEMLKNQMVVMHNELHSANERLKDNSTELLKLNEIEKRYTEEQKKLTEEMAKMKFEYEMKLEQTRGSNYALNLAHQHIENRIKTISQKHEKELENDKQLIEKLKEENENLKQRVCAGAYEYTLLNKKYLKLKNYTISKLQLNANVSTPHKQEHYNKHHLTESTIRSQQLKELDDLLEGKIESSHVNKNLNEESCILTKSASSYDQHTLVNELINNDDNSLRRTLYLPLSEHTTPATSNLVNLNAQFNKLRINSASTLLTPLSAPLPSSSSSSTIGTKEAIVIARALAQMNNENTPTNVPSENDVNNIKNEIKVETSLNNRRDNEIVDKNNIQSGSCDICGLVYPSDADDRSVIDHVTSHYGPTCPVCYLTFRKGYPQEDYESHVNGHFTN